MEGMSSLMIILEIISGVIIPVVIILIQYEIDRKKIKKKNKELGYWQMSWRRGYSFVDIAYGLYKKLGGVFLFIYILKFILKMWKCIDINAGFLYLGISAIVVFFHCRNYKFQIEIWTKGKCKIELIVALYLIYGIPFFWELSDKYPIIIVGTFGVMLTLWLFCLYIYCDVFYILDNSYANIYIKEKDALCCIEAGKIQKHGEWIIVKRRENESTREMRIKENDIVRIEYYGEPIIRIEKSKFNHINKKIFQNIKKCVLKGVGSMITKLKKWFKQNIPLFFTSIFTLITFIFWLSSEDSIDFSDLWLNLLAGFIASLCTIIVIDRTIKKQKEREEKPLKLALYRDVQLLTSRVIHLWNEMYIQCNNDRKNIPIDELFSKIEMEKIYTRLDLEGEPNVFPERNWYTYVREHVEDFSQRGNDILDRYVAVAEPELTQAIHYLVNDSAFCQRLSLIYRINDVDKHLNTPRIPVIQSYTCVPADKDIESINVIFRWCRKNYIELKNFGIVYEIPKCVVIENEHVKPKSVLNDEKFQKCLNKIQQWQQQTRKDN